MITRRVKTSSLMALLFLLASGCAVTSTYRIPLAEVEHPKREDIQGVTTISGVEVEFDTVWIGSSQPRATVTDGVIHSVVDDLPFRMRLEDVSELWVKRTDSEKAVLTVVVAAGVVALAVYALRNSGGGYMKGGWLGATVEGDTASIPPRNRPR